MEGGENRNTRLLGTILEALGEGGVGGSAGWGAGVALHYGLGQMALEGTHVTVRFVAVVRHRDREAVGWHLRLYGRVVRHSGDGDGDGGVWRNRAQLAGTFFSFTWLFHA